MDKEHLKPQTSNLKPKRKRVYISGPMTGLTRREFLRRFAVAEVALKRLGYEPVNPARFVVCRPWLFRLLGYRLTLIYDLWRLSQCDAIASLPGSTVSKGSCVESDYARAGGIPFLEENVVIYNAVERDIVNRHGLP